MNINGSLNLARQAKAAGVSRFIFASSCIVYGFSEEIRTEESALNPLTLYAESKVITEQKLRELADDNFCVTFMRNATVYGVSYRMRFDLVVNIMTFSAYTNHKIHVFGEGEQWRPLLHVRDVARAFILACDAPQEAMQCEVFNLGGSDENYQIRDLTHLIQEVFPSIEVKNFFSEPDNRSYKVNCDKIQRVLGFKAQITPKEGIIEVKQALEQGKLKYTLQTRTVEVYKQLLEAQLLQAQSSTLSCALV
jgi:nucleoside-diphosphate-sugar epimerase